MRVGGESLSDPASDAEQFGDAEVEQLCIAFLRDQDIRRLDIPMDDQVAVRMSQRTEHVEHQPDARLDAQAVRGAVVIDACPLHVFQDEVRAARRGDPGVDQPRDVRMRETRQQSPFTPKPVERRGGGRIAVEELERELSLEPAVAALREPHLAHSAAADERDDGVGAHLGADLFLIGRRDQAGLQKSLGLQSAPVRHHGAQRPGDRGLLILEPREVAVPLRLVHVEQSVEMPLDRFPFRIPRTNSHAPPPSF